MTTLNRELEADPAARSAGLQAHRRCARSQGGRVGPGAGRRDIVIAWQPQHPPAANVVKLSGNFLIGSVIESLGEAIALTRKSGVD